MKERIRELQFQAAAQIPPLLVDSEWQREFTEKFAELIVRECLHIVDDEGAGEGGCIRAMIRIQEEFGVKQ